jgi:nucleotidyltransferase-like protein
MAPDAKIDEAKIAEFVRRCREADEANLEAIILFGSAVSGHFHPGLSDLNMFCVLRDASLARLLALGPTTKWWTGQKQPPPLCMTRQELERSTDVFTIELLDMVQHHRVLHGQDVLRGLHIPLNLHRVQVEYELREKLILLRQHLLVADDNDSRLWDVLLHSAPSFATLFRHALIVLGTDAPPTRREAVHELAKRMQFDLSAIVQVLDVRERRPEARKLDVKELCGRYLAAIEKVAGAVDEATDSDASPSR